MSLTVEEALCRPRAVLFDWDNTLVDTWPVIHEALNTTLVAMGHAPWTMEETRARVRQSLRDSFPVLFGDRWEEARDIFYRRFEEVHLTALAPLPGVEDMLAELADEGLWLAVVSNKAGPFLRKEAAHLGWERFFRKIVGATDASRDKPARDVVEAALAGSGIDPGPDVWFVGDTAIDVECALNAACVPVLLGPVDLMAGEFDRFRPCRHFGHGGEIVALVRTL